MLRSVETGNAALGDHVREVHGESRATAEPDNVDVSVAAMVSPAKAAIHLPYAPFRADAERAADDAPDEREASADPLQILALSRANELSKTMDVCLDRVTPERTIGAVL